ncbi:MAG: AMP-binding protein [Paraprevotella sp.]|nr:AMP-binding protein [Paraprevotella sp.]
MTETLIGLIENSIRQNWDRKAFTDFNGESLQYKDLARKIAKIHLLFEASGLCPGDKIALCGRNSGNWCVAFLATLTYGAVIVPILHEFKPDNVHHIVNHSEAKLLLVGDQVWENLNENRMPDLLGIICVKDFTLVICRSESLSHARKNLNSIFGQRFPMTFHQEHIGYTPESSPEELAVINYTSGTTGFSKGVMLPYRSLLSNVRFCNRTIGLIPGDNIVSMLPMGHVFGLVYDFLYGVCYGAHLYFLTRMPSPKIIITTVAEIHPRVISCVPLVIEKMFKKEILPKIDNKLGKLLLNIPIISDKVRERACMESLKLFGGNIKEVIIGGAPFNAEMEAFVRSIGFPYSIAYGMTECGPIICHSPWYETAYMSCGKVADGMEVKVDSHDPARVPGELLCRGDNTMLGYYKNPEATAQIFDSEGLLHTGDMAIINSHGDVYIKGRCKNMLLSSSGQNIYPEEIESRLNNMPYINESLIIMCNDKLVALVHPDFAESMRDGLNDKELAQRIDTIRLDLNKELPPYSQITKVWLQNEEFEKTAKKSIKRYLYQNMNI